MPAPAVTRSASPPPTRLGLAWPLVLAALTLLGWFVADAAVRSHGGWRLELFLVVFPLPYLAAFVLLAVGGAHGAVPSRTARVVLVAAALALLAPMSGLLAGAGLVVGAKVLLLLGTVGGLLLSLAGGFDRGAPILYLALTIAICAAAGAASGAALFEGRRRLGLFAADIPAWRAVDLGGGAWAGALALPVAAALRALASPAAAGPADDLAARLLAAAVLGAAFVPHAVASWLLSRRSQRQIGTPWAGVSAYALLLCLGAALLS